jgi:hypothetical protein
MLPVAFMIQFAVTWVFILAYLASLFGLALRLRRLKAEQPGLDAPSIDLRSPTLSLDLLAVLKFAFSGRHASIGDAPASRLVLAVRMLLPLGLVLVLTLFVRAGTLAL